MSMSIKASPDGTYGEILVNGAVVAKLPVTGNAVIPGLVGTVSQSGGVPTGAIIERGSNANGEFVRFADGTQICYSTVAALAGSDVLVTFPAMFVGTPVVTGNQNGAITAPYFSSFAGINNSTAALGGYTGATRASFLSSVIAIGRWF